MQKPQYPQQSQPSEEEFMKISDHSEAKSSNRTDSQVEQYPFDQLENILDHQEVNAKKQIFYKEKIRQLQLKCKRLFNTASFLTKRIEELQIEISHRQQAQVNHDQLEEFIETIQSQVEEYKKDLNLYREKVLALNKKYSTQVQQLTKTIEGLNNQNSQLQDQVADLQDKNNELKSSNQNLVAEIESLSEQLNEVKATKSYSRASKSYSRTAFEYEIQVQLQGLIEKLMGQLEIERNNNKKAYQDVKRLQEQVLAFERQIVSKNNKIYSLQMSQIKSNRSTINSPGKSDRASYQANEKFSYQGRSDRSRKSLSLEQYLASNAETTEKQRLLIASKIMSFYIKKFQESDFDPYHPNQLMLLSYTKGSPSQTLIKKMPNLSPYTGERSAKILSWNLSVILSKLLIQPSYDSQYFDENAKLLTQAIDEFSEEKKPVVDDYYALKGLFDELAKSIK